MISLEGKVIAVTGGTRGIGESIVRTLCGLGAHVYSTYHSNPQHADRITNEITSAGGVVEYRAVDVANEHEVVAFVEWVLERGSRLDVLINNAGITRDGLIMRMNANDWHDVIATNLSAVFFACKAAARPMMQQRQGRIINIGSVVGLGGNAGQVNYSAAKAGVVGLTRSLAKELASRNVFVNCIAPGFVDTDMTEKLTEEQKQQYYAAIPVKRPARVEEIANTVAFFASEASSYITGQVLDVDGGLSM
jgi:3-oxoacyl-[acyl-carrier protein] reductase